MMSLPPPRFPVLPHAATSSPSGEIAAAWISPSPPSPMGGRRVRSKRPLARSQTRTVLSGDEETAGGVDIDPVDQLRVHPCLDAEEGVSGYFASTSNSACSEQGGQGD